MLRIHEFSGFSQSELLDRIGGTERYFDQYDVTPNAGWKSTRAAGILAALLSAYPNMTASAVAAWAYHNGLPADWEINTDQDDGTLLSGTIYFLDDYPIPDTFFDDFRAWSSGDSLGVTLPNLPAAPVTISEADAESLAPGGGPPAPSAYVASQPAPIFTPTATSTPPAAPQPVATPQPQPIPAPKPTSNAPATQGGGIPMWVFIVAVIVIFMMMSKKGKKR